MRIEENAKSWKVGVMTDNDESRAECVSVEVVTNALLLERGYKRCGAPYECAFGAESFMLPVTSLRRVRTCRGIGDTRRSDRSCLQHR
jgi:hypothetical protein